jgi:photosynthetic reaction center cytochrome c subunit
MKIGRVRTSLVAVGTLMVCLLGVTVAARQAPPPQLAEDIFTNVQVLRGLPLDEFMGTMGFFSTATGLNCTDCHVEESGGDWARYADDNELKQTTRRMLLMMNAINRTNFGGRQVVTCVTCHRGVSRPAVMPSIDLLYSEPLPDEPGDPFVQFPGQPAPDEVLDRYIAAIGGMERAASLTSFAATGTYMGFDDAEPAPLEILASASGQRSAIVHGLLGDATTTLDGRAGWIAAPLTDKPVPLLMLTGQELEGVELEAALFFPAGLKQALSNWRVGLPILLGDREAVPVQGTTAGGGVATLAFDAETNLLLRLTRYAESPVGRLVSRIDYSDYRDVAGVQMPFRWTVSWLSGRSTFELTDVQPNVPVDPARFAMPAQ